MPAQGEQVGGSEGSPAGGTPAPQQQVPDGDVVESDYDLGAPEPAAEEEKDPNAGAPVFESYIGAPIMTPSVDPIVIGHSQAPLDELATNPLGEPSNVLAPDAPSAELISAGTTDPVLDAAETQLEPLPLIAAPVLEPKGKGKSKGKAKHPNQPNAVAAPGAPAGPAPELSIEQIDQVIEDVLEEPAQQQVAAPAEEPAAPVETAPVEPAPVAPAEPAAAEQVVVQETPAEADVVALAAPAEPAPVEPAPVEPAPVEAAPAPAAAAPEPVAAPVEQPAEPATEPDPAPTTVAPAAPAVAVAPVAPAPVVAAPVAYAPVVLAPAPPPPPPPVTPALLEATAQILAGGAAIVAAAPNAELPAPRQNVALVDSDAGIAADVLSADVGDAGVALSEPADEPGDATPAQGTAMVATVSAGGSGERQDETAYSDVAAGPGGEPAGATTELAAFSEAFYDADRDAAAARGPPAGDQPESASGTVISSSSSSSIASDAGQAITSGTGTATTGPSE